jgi:peptidoglycan/LPS O-acetylase OafA/YrhL
MITLLGFFGLFKRPKILLLLTIALAAVYWSYPQNLALGDASSSIPVSAGLGTQILRKFTAITLESPTEDVRLLSIFLAGSCFYMFRNVIVFRAAYAVPAMIMLVGCLFSRRLAESGIAIFGGYIIFWFALHIEAFSISQFFNKTDLSYGIYLYAWPIQQALISQLPQITPVELFFLSLGFSLIIAFFSWSFVEKPFLNLKQPSTPRGGVS